MTMTKDEQGSSIPSLTKSELNSALEPLMTQVAQLEAALPRTPYRIDPLAIIGPVTSGEMAVQRDDLMRQACALMDQYFGVIR